MNRYFGKTSKVRRTQRRPQYGDEELKPFFAEVANGYCFRQSAERAGMDWKKLNNTLDSDDETLWHSLDLSIVAGAKIRSGMLPIPDRYDGLYKD